MKLNEFKRINGSSDQVFTLFVSMDGGQTRSRSAVDRVLAGVTGRAEVLATQEKITHYVITRGEWEA
jgi:hypothetical protein